MQEKYKTCDYLIISDPNNDKADKKILDFLRKSRKTFSTGFYFDDKAFSNMKSCIWYSFTDSANKAQSIMDQCYFAKAFDCGKNKMLVSDGCFQYFQCNCADVDLPMIEDVWEKIGLKSMEHDSYDDDGELFGHECDISI